MDNYYGNICYCRRCNGVVHTIKKGDTLYLISKYYKVPIEEIMGANRNINIYNLQIGDEICIPVKRPEPRESAISDNMNIINPEMGNDMTDRMSYGRTGVEPEAQVSAEVTDYMIDNEPDSVAVNSTAINVKNEDLDVQSANMQKVSDLIGKNDITVEELAKMLKKYM